MTPAQTFDGKCQCPSCLINQNLELLTFGGTATSKFVCLSVSVNGCLESVTIRMREFWGVNYTRGGGAGAGDDFGGEGNSPFSSTLQPVKEETSFSDQIPTLSLRKSRQHDGPVFDTSTSIIWNLLLTFSMAFDDSS